MCGLDEPGEFTCRDEGDIAGSSAPDDYRFLLVYDLIENARQIFTEARVRCFKRHWVSSSLLYSIPVRPDFASRKCNRFRSG